MTPRMAQERILVTITFLRLGPSRDRRGAEATCHHLWWILFVPKHVTISTALGQNGEKIITPDISHLDDQHRYTPDHLYVKFPTC
jgi:hypothetical protein